MERKAKRDLISEFLKEGNGEWKDFERILLTVVGATLAATITFFTASDHLYIYRNVLRYSWVSLIGSVISLMLSYLISEIYTDNLIKEIEKAKVTDFSDADVSLLKNKWLRMGIVIFNFATAILAIVGIALLAIFGSLNIG